MDIEASYREYKPLLFRVAYRLLGTAQEAEDAVHDAFVALQSSPPGVDHPKAYLVKAVTNQALNKLKSPRMKRETYTGPWLPEPLPGSGDERTGEDPAEAYMRHQRFGYAWMVMLEKLSPAERAVFVLRETLQAEYAEIADMLGRNEAACRKLYSRAKAKLAELPSAEPDRPDEGEAFVRAFTEAAQKGNFEPLIRLLKEDAVLVSDGGGKVRAALRPIRGKERVLAFFRGIGAKGSLRGEWREIRISGQRGLLLQRPEKPPFVISYRPAADGGIDTIYFISNPDKLTHFKLF